MAAADVIKKPPTSPQPPQTPPSNPVPSACGQVLTLEYAQQFLELLKAALANQTLPNDAQNTSHVTKTDFTPAVQKARASRLEFKTVDERWNEKTNRYETAESSPPREVDGLDMYLSLAHGSTSEPVLYIEIKSGQLRDILRAVLHDVHGVSLSEDKPVVERNLLYHYLPELEAYQNGEITYDLLWTLFKPNTIVYTTCLDTEKSTCFRFDRGEEKTTTAGVTYFHMECRYLDSDGIVFGEASAALGVAKYAGFKRIVNLEAFALEYHSHRTEVRARLVEQGRRFVSMLGIS